MGFFICRFFFVVFEIIVIILFFNDFRIYLIVGVLAVSCYSSYILGIFISWERRDDVCFLYFRFRENERTVFFREREVGMFILL